MASELLILALDLVKNRVGVMSQEMKKNFIAIILIGLIEKTPDHKVLSVSIICGLTRKRVKLKFAKFHYEITSVYNFTPMCFDHTVHVYCVLYRFT